MGEALSGDLLLSFCEILFFLSFEGALDFTVEVFVSTESEIDGTSWDSWSP